MSPTDSSRKRATTQEPPCTHGRHRPTDTDNRLETTVRILTPMLVTLALSLGAGLSVAKLTSISPTAGLIAELLACAGITTLVLSRVMASRGHDVLLLTTALLLGISVFPQSIWSKGIHLSVSDLLLITLLLVISATRLHKTPHMYLALMGVYLAYLMSSFFWSQAPRMGVVPLIQFLEFMGACVFIFYQVDTFEGILLCCQVYLWLATATALAAILAGGFHPFAGGLYVLGLQKNVLGQIVGDALPLCLGMLLLGWPHRGRATKYYAAFALNAFALVVSLSRGAMLGAGAGILLVLLLSGSLGRFRSAGHIGVVALACGSACLWYIRRNPILLTRLLDLSPGSSAGTRVLLWQDALAKIRQAPLLGHGLGTYFISLPTLGFQQHDPNNLFLLTWHDSGVIGLALFGALVLYLFVLGGQAGWMPRGSDMRILHAALFAGLVGQLVHWQVDVSWVRGTSIFLGGMIGLLLSSAHAYRAADSIATSSSEVNPLDPDHPIRKAAHLPLLREPVSQ